MEGGKNRLRVVVSWVFFRSGRGGSALKLMKLKLPRPWEGPSNALEML